VNGECQHTATDINVVSEVTAERGYARHVATGRIRDVYKHLI
jgi:hypothetical protein